MPGILISQNKDPYKPSSIWVFFVAHFSAHFSRVSKVTKPHWKCPRNLCGRIEENNARTDELHEKRATRHLKRLGCKETPAFDQDGGPSDFLGGGFKYFFFHHNLGQWSILTIIFQMGWFTGMAKQLWILTRGCPKAKNISPGATPSTTTCLTSPPRGEPWWRARAGLPDPIECLAVASIGIRSEKLSRRLFNFSQFRVLVY